MRLVGVTELQGFYFSQAVPAEEIEDLAAAFGRTNAPASDRGAELKAKRLG
jgi:hypothetical protein